MDFCRILLDWIDWMDLKGFCYLPPFKISFTVSGNHCQSKTIMGFNMQLLINFCTFAFSKKKENNR